MTLSHEEREILIENYIRKSRESIETVRFLIENSKFSLAANRIYYSVYYMLSALAVSEQFKTSKHEQLIGWFNRIFIKENKIDRRYGKLTRKFYENRNESDYDVFSDFSREETEQSFEEMKETVSEIQKLIEL